MYFFGRHVDDGNARLEDAHATPRASATSFDNTRLSRISCNTKYAIVLNQIDRMEIRRSYERECDGVTMYELDIYVRYVQTGIPTLRRSRHSAHTEPEEDMDGESRELDELVQKRVREKNPNYRLTYRFADFYRLRQELKEVAERGENPLHHKWCIFCCRLNWILHDAPFPLRSPFDKTLNKFEWFKRWRVRRKQVKLTQFLDRVVRGARSVQYRFSGEPCEGFLNVSYILKEFLTEPHVRMSGTGW